MKKELKLVTNSEISRKRRQYYGETRAKSSVQPGAGNAHIIRERRNRSEIPVFGTEVRAIAARYPIL